MNKKSAALGNEKARMEQALRDDAAIERIRKGRVRAAAADAIDSLPHFISETEIQNHFRDKLIHLSPEEREEAMLIVNDWRENG